MLRIAPRKHVEEYYWLKKPTKSRSTELQFLLSSLLNLVLEHQLEKEQKLSREHGVILRIAQ